ncbi:MAG TPA: hypothetical protein VFB62_10995, partial [Polyangiaceae bacterium]|nr:hypothetical protein [Polyangiaceae bacterium]
MVTRAAALALLVLMLVLPAHADEPVTRWTAATPDEMVSLSLSAAERGGHDALARVLMLYTLHDEASFGKVHGALERIARGKNNVAADAHWLALALAPEESTPWSGISKLRYDGGAQDLLRSFAILGPFEDTGGGLARREGPEAEGHRWVGADYSWGVYAVQTRRSLVDTVTARGVPLDLYVHPRSESCTYLGSVVTVLGARPVVVRIATSGSFRMSWDGTDLTSSEEVHPSALVDRAAVRVDATAGKHLLLVKVCSGARPDTGRVRVRFTDEQSRALSLRASSVPAELDRIAKSQVRFTKVPTNLESSLDSSAVDRALVAAAVRTLAGADDLRANKAPGLLDRVVGDSGIDADRLAFAGYLSGFAANKSGWLTRALERARREGDTAGASFAQRALVATRLDARLLDLAKATADKPPMQQSRDAHARWLRALTLSRLGGAGLRHAALRELRSLASEQRHKTPLVVWQTLAELGDVAPEAEQLGAWQKLAEHSAERRGPSYVAAHRMLGPAAFEAAAMSVLLQQTDARELTIIAQQLVDAGRYRAARDAFVLATLVAPNRPAGFEGLTKVDTFLARNTGTDEHVLEPLDRALQLEPSDARLAAELAFRRGESDSGPRAGEDAAYIVSPKEFLARGKKKPAPKDGIFDRQLHWRRVVRLHDDKRVSQLMHYAREIIVEPRTENERYENLPGGYDTELLIARVHKKDGSVVAPEEQDASGPMVRWPKLERGDVVEVAVRNWTPGPVGRRGDPPFYFSDYAGSVDTHPVLYNEVVIDAPVNSPLAFDIVGGKADERREETRRGRKITRLVWNNPPTIPDEPLAPNPSELLPVVV